MKITPKQLRSLVEDHGIWLGSVNLFGDCRQQFLKEGGRTYYTHVLWLLEFYLDDYQEKIQHSVQPELKMTQNLELVLLSMIIMIIWKNYF